mmetsp:Transcript_6068/g.8656  ORF Transcript_6068/g.8656 Transcript_6068/m.8656 type:complete len:476 (-) Transcript_6068:76-1503(-)
MLKRSAMISRSLLGAILYHRSFVTSLSVPHGFRIGVIGGGASGMFSAATAASHITQQQRETKVQVDVLEATTKLMKKVEISGGGRCNVLHDTSKSVPEILNGYPRGKKELNGLLTKHFSPSDAQKWFESRGVVLKTESDGRMFPVTDSSQTIMDAILDCARENDVNIGTKQKVVGVRKEGDEEQFTVSFGDEQEEKYDAIILATGSNPLGWKLAESLGHSIVPPVPSLFTFNTKNQNKEEGQVFHNLSGVSVQHARTTLRIKVEGKKKKKILSQEGPLLVTHHGISGPAVLRLSAFAAREFKDLNYRTEVQVHWSPDFGTAQEIESRLWDLTSLTPKRNIATSCPLLDEDGSTVIPRRLWSALVLESGFDKETTWAEAKKKMIGKLSRTIAEFAVDVTGKGVFKEEFVTAGGIKLKEITMKTMESKKCPGLFFCGEVIDVDGVTGGYNFMNCWSTGHTAGTNAVSRLKELTTSIE